MISVTTAVANEINKLSRRWSAKLLKVSDSSEIVCDIKSIVIHKGACGTFAVGSVFIPYIEMEVFGTPSIDSEFKLQLGIDISGTANYIDMGYFVVTSYKETTNTIKYVAQGRLYKMGKEVLYENETSAKYLSDIINDVEDVGYNIVYKNGLTLPSVQIKTGFHNISCRSAIQIVATCVGGFVTEDNAGNICLCKYNGCETADLTVDGDRSTSEPEILGEYSVNGCVVRVSSSLVFEEPDANLEVTNPYFNEDMWGYYKANLTGLEFECCNAKVTLGDPRLEAWDCVKIIDNNDVEHMVPCLTLTWTFKGGLTMNIDATATLPVDEGALSGGPLTKALEELSTATDEIATYVEASAMDVNVLYDVTDHIKEKASYASRAQNEIFSPTHSIFKISNEPPDSNDVIMASIYAMGGSTFHANQIAKRTTNEDWEISGGSFGAGNTFTLNGEGSLRSRYIEYESRIAAKTSGHAFVTFQYMSTGEATLSFRLGGYYGETTVSSEPSRYTVHSFVFGDMRYFSGGEILITNESGSSQVTIKNLQIFLGDGTDFGKSGASWAAWLDAEKIRNCLGTDDYFEFGNEDYSSRVTAIKVWNYDGPPKLIYEQEIPSEITSQPHYGEAIGLRYAGGDTTSLSSDTSVNFVNKEYNYYDGSVHYVSLDIPDNFLQRIRVADCKYIEFVQEGEHTISPYVIGCNGLGGTFVEFVPDESGGEPNTYIKDASVSGNTLTLTKKDGSTVPFTPTGGGGSANIFEIVYNFGTGVADKTYAEILAAINANKSPIVCTANMIFLLEEYNNESNTITFSFHTRVTSASKDAYFGYKLTVNSSNVWTIALDEGHFVPNFSNANVGDVLAINSSEIPAWEAGGGGGEPAAYIKNASVNGNTLTLTKKDDSTVVFTPSGGGAGVLVAEYGVTTLSQLLNAISAGKVVYELYDDGQIFIPAHVVESEVTFRVANFMEALGADYFSELSAEYHIVTEDGWETVSGFYHDSAKQDVLTAGSGISIVNNVISATGGGGSSDVLVVHYDGGAEPGDKSYSEIASALNQRKLVVVICQGMPFFLYGTYPSVMFRYYQAFKEDEEYLVVYTISVDEDDTWSLDEDYFLYCPVPGEDIVPGATLKINENGSPAWVNPT